MQRRITSRIMRVVALTAISIAAVNAQQSPSEVIDVLDGLDPVELVAGREAPGVTANAVTYRGYRYLFLSPENAAAFRKQPEKYEPVSGGTCARMGPGGPGNPALFTVFEGRIYLFASDTCRRAFVAAPQKYIEPAIVSDTDVARLKAGRSLLDAAAQAMGGGALKALTGYSSEHPRLRGTPNGKQNVDERVTVLFPDAIRIENRLGQQAMVSAAATDDMFLAMATGPKARVMRWAEAPRTAVARDMTRRILLNPVALLWAHLTGGVVATAVDVAGSDRTVDHVRVTARGLQLLVAIAHESKLPASITYDERGADGAFAPLTLTFSDYRTISGVTVPFVVNAHSGSQALPEQSFTLTSWTPNPAITRSELMRESVTLQEHR